MLKLKLQCFGHLTWRAGSLEKTLMLGKIEGHRRRGQQRMKWLNSITDTMDMNLSKALEIVKDSESCSLWSWKEWDRTEWLNNKNNNIFYMFTWLHMSYWPGIKPGPPVLEAQSLSHWVTRKVSPSHFCNFSLSGLWQYLHLYEIFWRASLGIKDSSSWGHGWSWRHNWDLGRPWSVNTEPAGASEFQYQAQRSCLQGLWWTLSNSNTLCQAFQLPSNHS